MGSSEKFRGVSIARAHFVFLASAVAVAGCGDSSGAADAGNLDACGQPVDPCQPWHGMSCGLCSNTREGFAWSGSACGVVGGCDITAPVDRTYDLCVAHHAVCGAMPSDVACDGGSQSCVWPQGSPRECVAIDDAGTYRCIPAISAPEVNPWCPAGTPICQME